MADTTEFTELRKQIAQAIQDGNGKDATKLTASFWRKRDRAIIDEREAHETAAAAERVHNEAAADYATARHLARMADTEAEQLLPLIAGYVPGYDTPEQLAAVRRERGLQGAATHRANTTAGRGKMPGQAGHRSV